MRADAFFEAVTALPVAAFETILPEGGLVVVAPHPDDESLGCGGLIAQALARGRSVRVVIVSDGCGSHPNSKAYPHDRLRSLREAETVAAMAALGLGAEHIHFLRLPDGGVPSEGPQAEAAAARIADIAREAGARAVFVTWRHDPHCDHTASAAIVDLAQAHLPGSAFYAYPVWGWTLPPEREVGAAPSGYRLAVEAERAAKRRAVEAHASQVSGLIEDDPAGFQLQPAMIDRLTGPYEWFIALPD
ncbi:PIG-L deacetylase family protein [Methylorubrum suomiense]|uniref:1D-myo-inositol 2-acetamido-2-deoxy-alpha-D-glucopyranoside deacetylase n=1 Tax=Methylorubrum suomiense TaxID=144191 RepID=A0ABQ4UNJ9_9HYPH|nr:MULTISPECIES: PIG-L family deacetylase [Methylobacteriaceae]GJE73783.1 1D-myo-inositol 2-acetamido-2-deoxy-alpha-D-glucopyranoside deacetylase [Methylorubrum suomiense]